MAGNALGGDNAKNAPVAQIRHWLSTPAFPCAARIGAGFKIGDANSPVGISGSIRNWISRAPPHHATEYDALVDLGHDTMNSRFGAFDGQSSSTGQGENALTGE
jgi:hypothetical protein